MGLSLCKIYLQESFYRTEIIGYDVPDFKSKRATSFGFGERKIPVKGKPIACFISLVDSPSPTNYEIKSTFDPKKPEGSAFTFGVAREHCERVS